jgi:hypothetical protein
MYNCEVDILTIGNLAVDILTVDILTVDVLTPEIPEMVPHLLGFLLAFLSLLLHLIPDVSKVGRALLGQVVDLGVDVMIATIVSANFSFRIYICIYVFTAYSKITSLVCQKILHKLFFPNLQKNDSKTGK